MLKEPRMSKTQLKFDFQGLKIGDLVKENSRHPNGYKSWGVVVEVDKENFFDQVKVHWLDYGTFWTTSDKLIKINNDEQV